MSKSVFFLCYVHLLSRVVYSLSPNMNLFGNIYIFQRFRFLLTEESMYASTASTITQCFGQPDEQNNVTPTEICIDKMARLINGYVREIEQTLDSAQIIPVSINQMCYTYYYNTVCYLSFKGLSIEDIQSENTILNIRRIGDINPEQYKYIYVAQPFIDRLQRGIALLKYGKQGKPKYKMFQIDKKNFLFLEYFRWYSTKKPMNECEISLKHIQRIAMGSKSNITNSYQKYEYASFTIHYRLDNELRAVTMTAETEKEAIAVCWFLEILSKLKSEKEQLLVLQRKNESAAAEKEDRQVLNCFSAFRNRKKYTSETLLKEHATLKERLQKCVDFVMTKKNYRAISNCAHGSQFEAIKAQLQNLDNRLNEAKTELEIDTIEAALILTQCAAILDALKEQLNTLSKNNMKMTLRF